MSQQAARQGPKFFKLGQKQVFLPNHVITLVRKDHQPADWVTFKVPLRFTKFDLRDYLFNLYNVEAKKVRSWVKSLPVAFRGRRPYRPQSQKFMTVELDKPFAWPKAPEDLEPWSKAMWDLREQATNKEKKNFIMGMKGAIPLKSREMMGWQRSELRDKAQALLDGNAKWENNVLLDEKWDTPRPTYGETPSKSGKGVVVQKEVESEGTGKVPAST